jgi:rhodanese-related sulfurtransferase
MTQPQTAAPSAVPFGDDCIVLDVRTGAEHDEVALKQPHRHVPLDRLDPAQFLRDQNILPARAVYMLCRSGKRATRAAEAFIAAGHDNVKVIEGGILACEASGVPVRKGREIIPLERQVRIAAGALVLAGWALGVFVSPLFYALCAFAGAGLVFSGVTDTCGMAYVLARAPWNKGAACSVSASSCAASAAPVSNGAGAAPSVKMPDGTTFYSPASGASVSGTSSCATQGKGGACT